MPFTVAMVTFDTTDARELSSWWAERTGAHVALDADGEYIALSLPQGQPALAFQQVAEPTPGKNRVHLDLVTDDLDADVAAFVAAGATEVARHDIGFRWVTLADPHGNQFCVAQHGDVG